MSTFDLKNNIVDQVKGKGRFNKKIKFCVYFSVFSFFGEFLHPSNQKIHMEIVQQAFLEVFFQKSPYFEEKQSQVITFRR